MSALLTLTDGQRAALAKLACGVESPGGVAILCGPPGTGKTTVLAHLADGQSRAGRRCISRQLAAWDTDRGSDASLFDLFIVDDAHESDAEAIARLLAACRSRRADAAVVLAGEGRLLTLVSRDHHVEQAVGLRATLRPFSALETRRLLEPILPGAATRPEVAAVAQTIHEISAGIPRAALRLAELAAVVADSRADAGLTVADIELVHRRLSLQAA